jgi:hypothetical protein
MKAIITSALSVITAILPEAGKALGLTADELAAAEKLVASLAAILKAV